MGKFLGMFDPTREGPGVSKNGPQKKRFFVFFEIYFRKFTKIFLINILYALCCLPIITIGPATAGMTYCMRNFSREEHADVSDFFIQFKKNFWQSLLVWFVFTLCFGAVIFGIIFYDGLLKNNNFFGFIGMILCIISGVILLFMSYYVYMMIVTFKVNFRQIIKNSFIFAFAGLGPNLIITFFLAIIYGWFFIYGIFPVILPLFSADAPVYFDAVCLAVAMYLFFIPSLTSFIINFNIYPNVKKFMIDPYLSKENKDKEEDESIFKDAEE